MIYFTLNNSRGVLQLKQTSLAASRLDKRYFGAGGLKIGHQETNRHCGSEEETRKELGKIEAEGKGGRIDVTETGTQCSLKGSG